MTRISADHFLSEKLKFCNTNVFRAVIRNFAVEFRKLLKGGPENPLFHGAPRWVLAND